jgi:ferrochelatase
VVGLVLAPHYSRGSIGEYHARVREAIGDRATYATVDSYARDEALVDLLAANVSDSLRSMGTGADEVQVLFTAHSLPERVVADGDPYEGELRATAEAVAAKLDLPRWDIAWQSAGRTADPWIGPDVLDAMDDLAKAGTKAVLVCSAGFVSDHLEVLYDLDIEAAEHAEQLGIAFARTASPNDDPRFLDLLARVVQGQFAQARTAGSPA